MSNSGVIWGGMTSVKRAPSMPITTSKPARPSQPSDVAGSRAGYQEHGNHKSHGYFEQSRKSTCTGRREQGLSVEDPLGMAVYDVVRMSANMIKASRSKKPIVS